MNNIENIQKQIEGIIGVKTKLTRTKSTKNDYKKDLFINIITQFEQATVRCALLGEDFGIDMFQYDELYLGIITDLMEFTFGEEVTGLVFIYCADRLDFKETTIYHDPISNTDIEINSIEGLWEVVKKIIK